MGGELDFFSKGNSKAGTLRRGNASVPFGDTEANSKNELRVENGCLQRRKIILTYTRRLDSGMHKLFLLKILKKKNNNFKTVLPSLPLLLW